MPTDSLTEFLARVRDRYATCRSYYDTGTAATPMKLPQLEGKKLDPEVAARMENRIRFETWLVRDVGFRFQFADQARFPGRSDAYVILQSGDTLINWWEFRGIKTPESLRIAVSAAAGVSQGTSPTVPELLLPTMLGGGMFYLPQMFDAGGEVDVDDEPCRELLLKTRTPPGVRMPADTAGGRTFYVGMQSFLIRRLVTMMETPQGKFTTTIEYAPAIDVEVDPAAFDVAPWAERGRAIAEEQG